MPDEIIKFFKEENIDSDKMESFGVQLHAQFEVNRSYRRPKELEWIESLRQYKGIYDPSVKIDPNNSHIYPKLTRSKINTVTSRLHEMLFPDRERNFEIKPSPEPKISNEKVNQIAMSLFQQQQNPDGSVSQVPPQQEQVVKAIKEYCEETSTRMQNEVDDQLLNMKYSEEAKKVIKSGLLYGTGILAGPLVNKVVKRTWVPGNNGEYIEKRIDKDTPYMEFVRIWDWYPDMSITELNEATGFFHRQVMTKHDLRQLMKRPDFYKNIIKTYLKENPNGDYSPEPWEVDLQNVEVEAGTDQDRTYSQSSGSGSNDVMNRSSYRQGGKKYTVLRFWGYIDGSDLASCGIELPDGEPIDESIEYAAHIWLLGKKVIKAMLFDGALNHYKVFYFEKDETSIFGEGLARIMRHSQIAVASAARMVLDNGACVSGPQVEVNWSLLHEGTDLNSFYPRKIWYRDGRGIEAQYPAIRSLSFDSHISELIEVVNLFKAFADEETCLPTWLAGESVNSENSKQTSGRVAATTMSIKDVVRNFDCFTENVISDIYAWNMEFNEREDIKGDYECKALGVSSLVMKEVRMAALSNLKNTIQPEDWAYIPRRELLNEVFKAHDMDIKLRTEEEAQQYLQSMSDPEVAELQKELMKADVGYKKAQTTGQLTKAKKFNIEAEKEARTPIEQPAGESPELQNSQVIGQDISNKAAAEQIRRDEELHQQKLNQLAEKHNSEIINKTNKVDTDIENKTVMAEHAMQMKQQEQKVKAEVAKKQINLNAKNNTSTKQTTKAKKVKKV